MGNITFLKFKLYYKAAVIKIAWHWNKDRPSDQRDRIEHPEADSQVYDYLSFNKRAKKYEVD